MSHTQTLLLAYIIGENFRDITEGFIHVLDSHWEMKGLIFPQHLKTNVPAQRKTDYKICAD